MAYQINRFDNSILTSVPDGTIDNTTDLKLIGKNFAGYGEIQNENFLYLLESFSGANQPPRPISGQVWFDSANNKLKFFDGSKFKTTGGAEISATPPAGLSEGDFWWNNADQQLYAFNGSNFTLVGPQTAAGFGVTQLQPESVLDADGNSRTIIKAVINDNVVFVISNTEFTPGISNPIPGFTVIKKGVTLVNTNINGITSNDFFYWGTASNANKLGGNDASDFALVSDPDFSAAQTPVLFSDSGIKIGNVGAIFAENTNELAIVNEIGPLIKFKVRNAAGQIVHTTSVNPNGLIPAANSAFDIGNNSLRWRTIFADTFDGLATTASQLRLSTTNYSPSLGAANNTVALRDSSGNITANEFIGTATKAKFADLAEIYETDKEYPVGTVIAVGGDKEARAANIHDHVFGVISEKPAYLMNSDAEGQAIGLKGRVPVRVKGPVSKGQAVYAAEDGLATTIESKSIVGIALETNSDVDEKLVECVLKV